MTVAVKKLLDKVNGHKKTVIGSILALLGTGWIVNAQKNIDKVPVHDEWIRGHELWTTTTLKSVLDKIDAGDNAVERQIVIQTEASGEWRSDQRLMNERMLNTLDKMDKKLDDVKDRLPAKQP